MAAGMAHQKPPWIKEPTGVLTQLNSKLVCCTQGIVVKFLALLFGLGIANGRHTYTHIYAYPHRLIKMHCFSTSRQEDRTLELLPCGFEKGRGNYNDLPLWSRLAPLDSAFHWDSMEI